MKKILWISTLILPITLGNGCARPQTTKNSPKPVLMTPAPPQYSFVSSSTKPGWMTYTNTVAHFRVEIPSDWKIGEYISSGDRSKLMAVAFDPAAVLTQDEYRSIDKPAGHIWVDVSGSGSPAGRPTTRLIGAQRIPAKFYIWQFSNNTPNPFWEHHTEESYSFATTSTTINLNMYYETGKDQDLRKTIEAIFASFAKTP